MNVFILNTGRCGSATFAKACSHITNYSSGHETKSGELINRLIYPNNHIEVDNRLSWMLGSLAKQYPDAFYVHLTRNHPEVAESYTHRFKIKIGIMPAFSSGILMRRELPRNINERSRIASLYTKTVNDNITEFLKDKYHLKIDIETPAENFSEFWKIIEAEGDKEAALQEFKIKYNASRIQH